MPDREWYKDWFNSPFYHKLYFDRDEKEAQRLIKKLVDHLQPPRGCRMLDVACGKGRHSLYLSSLGYDVTGIDISPDSIRYANQFARENVNFYVHDMRLLFWVNYFDFAFNFFTSFGYFSTSREHDDAMRTIAAGLKPGGVVLFDYLNVHYVEDHLVPHETRCISDTQYDIARWQDEHYFFKKITVTDPLLSQPIEHTEKVAKFSLGDFTDMLAYQGVQVTDVFGNYDLNLYHVRKSPRMIVVGKKVHPH